MAGKKDKDLKSSEFEDDGDLDFDFGDELEFGELGEVKDDRKPVTKALDGFKSGMVKRAVDPDLYKDLIEEYMPVGYGKAVRNVDKSLGHIGDLYRDIAKQARPLSEETKKTARALEPMIDRLMPNAVSKKIKEWAKAEGGYASSEATQEQNIQAQLNSIFQKSAEAQVEMQESQVIRDEIQQGEERVRHKDSLGALTHIAENTDRLAQYQDNIVVNYQRKSLELQIRSYMQQVEDSKKSTDFYEVTRKLLSETVKNTALPEFVKLQQKEFMQQHMRNRFLDTFTNSLFPGANDYVERMGKHLRTRASGAANSVMQGITSGLQATNSVQEMISGMGGEVSEEELVGEMAGGGTTDLIAGLASRQIQKLFKNDKTGITDAVRRGSGALMRLQGDMGVMSDRFKNKYDWDMPLWQKALQWVLPETERENTAITQDKYMDANAPATFTNATRKSIVNAIPGYLARILREQQIIRTGNSKIGLIHFDYQSGTFMNESDLSTKIFETIVSKDSKENMRYNSDELMKEIAGDEEIPQEVKDAHHAQLMQLRLKGRTKFSDLTNEEAWAKGPTAPYAKDIANMYRNYLEMQEGEKFDDLKVRSLKSETNYNRGANLFRGAGGWGSYDPAAIQNYYHMGGNERSVMLDAGLIDKSGNIDKARILEYMSETASYTPGFQVDADIAGISPEIRKKKKANAIQQAMTMPNDAQAVKPIERTDTAKSTPILDSVKIVQAIEGYSSRSVAERIEELIKQGLGLQQDTINAIIDYGGVGGGNGRSGGEDGQPKSRWYNRRVGDFLGDTGSFMKRKAQQGWNLTGKLIKGAVSLPGKVLRGTKEKAKRAWDRLKNWRKEVADVYIKGEILPRLTAAKMKAGDYRDEVTGKVIRGWQDLSESSYRIIDEKTGEIIEISKDLIGKIELKFPFMKRITKGIKNLLTGGLKEAASKGLALVKGAPRALLKGVGKVAGLVNNALFGKYVDVYRADKMSEPLIKGDAVKEGKLFKVNEDGSLGDVVKAVWEITSPCKWSNGDSAITTDDLRAGLVDKNGKALTKPFDKIKQNFEKIKDGVSWGIGKAKDIITGGIKGVANFFSDIFGSNGFVVASRKTNILLLQIRNMIASKFGYSVEEMDVGLATGSFGKAMGRLKNLFRRGSVSDMIRRKKDDALDKARDLKDSAADKFDRMREKGSGAIRSAWDKAKGLGGALSSGTQKLKDLLMGGGEGGIMDTIAGLFGGKGGKIAGWGAKILGGLGLMKGGAAAAGALSTVGGAAAGAATTAATAGAAGTAATAAVGTAATGGLAAAGLALLPFIIGGAIVAGVGYAGWKGWKAITRKKFTLLDKVRYAQYGVVDDKDKMQDLYKLEEYAKQYVSGNKVNADKLNWDPIFELFGLDKEDPKDGQKLKLWLELRFFPVFSGWLGHLQTVTSGKGKSMDYLDGIKDKEQNKRLVELSAQIPVDYNMLMSPWDSDTSWIGRDDGLTGTKAAYDKVVEEVKVEIEKMKTTEAGTSTTEKLTGAAAILTGSSVASAETLTPAQQAASGQAPSGNNLAMSMQNAKADREGGSAGVFSVLGGSAPAKPRGTVSYLTSIRLRCYGLSSPKAADTAQILELEKLATEQVTYKGSFASFKGDLNSIVETYGRIFGHTSSNSPGASDFVIWFKERFLPVFLGARFAIKHYTNQDKIGIDEGFDKIKHSDRMATAGIMIKGYVDGKINDYWKVTQSPWPGVTLTTDSASSGVDAYIAKIFEASKSEALREQDAKAKAATPPKLTTTPNNPVQQAASAPSSSSGGTVQVSGGVSSGQGETAKEDSSLPSPQSVGNSAGASKMAMKAALMASQNAESKSKGLCARYVRTSLQKAGYKFTPHPSAYMYASQGTMSKMGFSRIANNTPAQIGDVVVFNNSAKRPHGHIQIFDGKGWVSDFRQRNFSPYSESLPYSTWRDLRGTDAQKALPQAPVQNAFGKSSVQQAKDQIAQGPAANLSKAMSTPGYSAGIPNVAQTAKEDSSLTGSNKVINDQLTLTNTAVSGNPWVDNKPSVQQAAGKSDRPSKKVSGTLSLSDKDVNDIVKVTSTEVVAGLNDQAFSQQAAGVVDTILNRVASGKWGNSVQNVVNARAQFSKINSVLKGSYGSIDKMPDSAVNKKTANFVRNYLAQRANGKPSIVGGHLDYANPNYSTKNNMGWINKLKEKFNIVLGSGKAVHYHGTTDDKIRNMPGSFKIELTGEKGQQASQNMPANSNEAVAMNTVAGLDGGANTGPTTNSSGAMAGDFGVIPTEFLDQFSEQEKRDISAGAYRPKGYTPPELMSDSNVKPVVETSVSGDTVTRGALPTQTPDFNPLQNDVFGLIRQGRVGGERMQRAVEGVSKAANAFGSIMDTPTRVMANKAPVDPFTTLAESTDKSYKELQKHTDILTNIRDILKDSTTVKPDTTPKGVAAAKAEKEAKVSTTVENTGASKFDLATPKPGDKRNLASLFDVSRAV